jgi:uncharacterized protein (TIGR00369 family)
VGKDPSPRRTRTITWDDPTAATHQSRRMSGSDFFEAMRRGRLPEAPFGRLLGIDLFDAGEGRFVLTLQPHEVHYNPMGCVHGGILATLLDSVMSAAVHTVLPAGKIYLTRELVVTFHRPVFDKTGEIMAEGHVVSVDAQLATAAGRIIASDHREYATGRATCVILDRSPGSAAGPPLTDMEPK